MTDSARSIYFAGELFDQKHLTGNVFVAQYIDKVSQGRYRTMLPQNIEVAEGRTEDIRNNDLLHLLLCDVAIFNFDGLELDSGTVVEFMMAKMLDVPCVCLRSDFRSSGDQLVNQSGVDTSGQADPWNLMCSFYPRSISFCYNSMQWYHEAGGGNGSTDFVEPLYTRIANALIENLDKAVALPSLAGSDLEKIEMIYRWAMKYPGPTFEKLCEDKINLPTLIEQKLAKGVLG
ncbi:MAG: nucleoside 2-deoxyribosyltransferase [Desulfovibrio sp.]